MTAYMLVEIELNDSSWVADYQKNVPVIMQRHGGERLAVSARIERHEGTGPDPDAIVLFTFPSMAAIDAFLSDVDYQPLKAARRAGSLGNLFAFSTGD